MAFARLIEKELQVFPQPLMDTEKAQTCALSVSGGCRKCLYNGDKPKARAITRAKSRIVTIILYQVNFLHSQIPSITAIAVI